MFFLCLKFYKKKENLSNFLKKIFSYKIRSLFFFILKKEDIFMLLEKINADEDFIGLCMLDKGCKDEKNGIDLGYNGKDICNEVVYMFGVSAGLYILNKKPKFLEKFLAKYHHLNKRDFFVYPTNIDKNLIDDATVLANSFLEIAKILTEEDFDKGKKKAPKELLEDLYSLLKEFYPEYSEGNEFDLKEEFIKVNGPLPNFE